MTNYMTLRVKAIPANESFVRGVVAGFTVPCDPTIDVINDVRTAISEAVTNCVVHAYGGTGNGDILIEGTLTDGLLTISVSDYGKGIENIEKAMEDFFTTKESEERSGLGFTIMKSFMDSLDVVSEKGAGTTVTMTKRLTDAER
ncbi:MAG: anti-sigma F factor [Christensenellales bacterium]